MMMAIVSSSLGVLLVCNQKCAWGFCGWQDIDKCFSICADINTHLDKQRPTNTNTNTQLSVCVFVM